MIARTSTPHGANSRMTRGRFLQFGVGAIVAGAALTAVPAMADAASSCRYGIPTGGLSIAKTMAITDGSGPAPLEIVRSGNFLGFRDSGGAIRLCSGPEGTATVTNTDVIVVSGGQAIGGLDRVDVNMSGGKFAPGLTPEPDGVSEIEVLVFGGQDVGAQLKVIGTSAADSFRVTSGARVMVGSDDDVDISMGLASRIHLHGGAGNDFLSGRGGGTKSESNRSVFIDGGPDDDTVVDSRVDREQVGGGDGNDHVFTVDGRRDFPTGGPGFDKSTRDAIDVVDVGGGPGQGNTFEQNVISGSVGRLRLTPGVLDARAGKPAQLKLSWTHPKAWKQLRTIKLRFSQGAEAMGTIAVRPEDGRLRGQGAVKVIAADSKLTHHGKTVTARLAVRLNRSLAGQDLRVDVQATDRKGHTQLEPQVGVIKVAK